MKRQLSLLLSLCVGLAPQQAGAAWEDGRLEVTVMRMHQDGQSWFEVHASGFAPASLHRTWQVLTDYERLPQFVPNLLASKIVSRNGSDVTIAQKGYVRFLFIVQEVDLTVRVREQPFSALDISLVSGRMKQYASHWKVSAATHNGAGGTRISYSGKLEPDFFVPPLLGAAILRRDVEGMLAAVIAEIARGA
jgi:ribosome-associated toxin RatA of RatAB toxin-antitoxin module